MEPHFLGPIAVWQHTTQNPTARLLLVHGISEHSGRHRNTVDFLTQNGIEVTRFDLRGMGRSGGRRQWIERFEDYVEDVGRVAAEIGKHQRELPLFLLGHSLGGAISLYFATHYQKLLAGLLLSAPAFKVGSDISSVKITLGKMVSRLLPELRVPSGDDYSGVSRDPLVVEAYAKDPLSCHFNTVRQGTEILNALEQIPRICGDLRLPVWIAHGSADRIIRLDGSFEIMSSLKSTSKELHILPGGYHEPHNDLDKEIYFDLLLQWIRKRSL